MKDLTIINHDGIHVIDSREVAEMLGRQHKNLLADIRVYVDWMEKDGKLKIKPSDFFIESTYQSEQNKTLPCYLLTKKGCDMVANKMTGEKGVLFTAAYVSKFHEMENAHRLPSTYIEALEALVVSEKEKLQLAEQNEIMRPKADYFDELVDRNLLTGFRETAKEFGVGQNKFMDFLLDRGFIYRDGKKKPQPYSKHVKNGLFELKEEKSDKNGWAGTRAFITPRGRETFRLLLKNN